MNDFLDAAADIYWNPSSQIDRTRFQRVFDTIGHLQRVHSKAQLDLNNIESIFTVLELGKVIGTFPGLQPAEISDVISDLKYLIVATLEERMLFECKEQGITAPPGYSQLVGAITALRRSQDHLTASIISFNYDIAIDIALYKYGLGPNYALKTSPSEDKHHPPLLKLHGSTNWAEDLDGQIRAISLKKYFDKYDFKHSGPKVVTTSNMLRPKTSESKNVRIGSKLSEDFKSLHDIEVRPDPVIVPPSWNKADYHQTLAFVWKAAAKELSEAEYIFVAGYSIPETDSFFRHLYALGSVGPTPLRKFVVVNPDTSGATEARYKKLLGTGAKDRFEYVPESFSALSQMLYQLRGL